MLCVGATVGAAVLPGTRSATVRVAVRVGVVVAGPATDVDEAVGVIVGGAAVTEEFAPGYRASTFSFIMGHLHPKVIADLELETAGLETGEIAGGILESARYHFAAKA